MVFNRAYIKEIINIMQRPYSALQIGTW